MSTTAFRVFADHRQFYAYDSDHLGAPDMNLFDGKFMQNMVISSPGFLGVFTMREFGVRVSVEVHPITGELDTSRTSQIVETSIHCPTGEMLVAGCTTPKSRARGVSVPSQPCAVTVLFEQLDSTYLGGLLGRDRYRIIMWPGALRPINVKRNWQAGANEG